MRSKVSQPPEEVRSERASSVQHGHGHGHHHHHLPDARRLARMRPVERARERRSLILTLLVTTTIMVLEAVGGWLSGSLALQADAGHMLTDASSLALAIFAITFAMKPADLRRTYGFYRMEILAALANGVLLLLVAGWVVWEAIGRLGNPEPIQVGTMALIAAIGLLANVVGLLLLHGRSHSSLNVRGAYLHVLGDALSSVGVLLAAGIIWLTGWVYADPLVSLGIAAVIVWGALRLVREAVDVLLEAVPAHLDLAEVLHAMELVEGVVRVHDLHIWTISSGMHALSAHVVVDSCDIGSNDQILRRMREMLIARFDLDHATLQIETPDHCKELAPH